MNNKKKSFFYPIIFMIMITAIFTVLLAMLNEATITRIEYLQDIELKQKILYVFDIDMENSSDQEIEETFNKLVEKETINDKTIYLLKDKDDIQSYAVPFQGPGLWGNIQGYIGLKKDLQSVTGIEFITQSETPGLGGRISEDPYKEQYRGIDISQAINGNYIINRPATGGNIDAIAGATLTSNFVMNMINEDLREFIQLIDKGEAK